jgi:hypothetical protein
VTTCIDGDACSQTDTCDGAGTCVGGNPVVCAPLDQCHDAGTCDTGTGVCSDPPSTNGTTCNDGNTCTIGDACTSGTCGGNSITCGDGMVQLGCNEDCDVPGGTDPNCTADCHFVCGPTPQAGCRTPALPGKGTALLKTSHLDKRDALNWKYIKGAATTLADFGDPLTATDHTLCIYDSFGASAAICLREACGRHVRHQAVLEDHQGRLYNDSSSRPTGCRCSCRAPRPRPRSS